jgi:hypothetical protein
LPTPHLLWITWRGNIAFYRFNRWVSLNEMGAAIPETVR